SRKCRSQASRTSRPATTLPSTTSRAYWVTGSLAAFRLATAPELLVLVALVLLAGQSQPHTGRRAQAEFGQVSPEARTGVPPQPPAPSRPATTLPPPTSRAYWVTGSLAAFRLATAPELLVLVALVLLAGQSQPHTGRRAQAEFGQVSPEARTVVPQHLVQRVL